MAESLLPDGRTLSADDDRGAGIAAGVKSALDNPVDRFEAFRAHAYGRGRLDGQPIAVKRCDSSEEEREKHFFLRSCGKGCRGVPARPTLIVEPESYGAGSRTSRRSTEGNCHKSGRRAKGNLRAGPGD